MILNKGTKVIVPHRGKLTAGTIVRYDNGRPHYSPFYIVDVGEYESIKCLAHRIDPTNLFTKQ